tara:strand:- start:760 stop:1017 length:258 start_codon:yes stop_codon:yes gene_type:complete
MKDLMIKSMDMICAFMIVVFVLAGMSVGASMAGAVGFLLGSVAGLLVSCSVVGLWMVHSSNNEQLRQINYSLDKLVRLEQNAQQG